MTLEELRHDLAVPQEGYSLIDLCLEVVILVEGPLAPAMPRVQALYDGFMRRYGDRIRLAYGYDDKAMRPYEPAEWADASRWLVPEQSDVPGSNGAHFQAGEPEANAMPPMFDAVHYAPSRELARSGVRMRLPAEELLAGSDAMRDRFVAMLAGLPLMQAQCGLAMSWHTSSTEARRTFQRAGVPRLVRHPGLGLGSFSFQVLHGPAGVMTINWLTALGPRLAERLGGAAALRAQLPRPCEVVGLPDGVVVLRAGPEPAAGDVNRNDRLPVYQAVARAVRPVWASDDYIGNISYPEMEPEVGDVWIARFF